MAPGGVGTVRGIVVVVVVCVRRCGEWRKGEKEGLMYRWMER